MPRRRSIPTSPVARHRRRLQVAALAAAGSLAVAACGSSGSSGSTSSSKFGAVGTAAHPTDITFWTTNSEPAQTTYLVDHFNATHPGIHVTGQYITSSDEITPKLVSAIKTGTEPSVVVGEDPSQLPLLAESGKIIPLNGKLDALTNALYPGVKSALFYKGQQLGMAQGGVGDYVLFYNKKDFAAAGITAPPATWTDLVSDAQKLSKPASHHYGIYIPLGSAEWISYDWEGLLWADGGEFLNPQGTKVAFNGAAGVQALTTWVDLIKDKAAPTTSFAQAGSYDGAPAFASDAVSMIIDGQFALDTFKTAGVDFGVAQFPKGTAGSATGVGVGVESLFDKSPADNEAGLQFITWLSEPAQAAYLDSDTGGLPSSPAQLSEPLVKAQQADDPTYSTFADNLASGRSRPSIPQYSGISMDLSNEINAALTGSVSPQQALDQAASQGDALLAGGGS